MKRRKMYMKRLCMLCTAVCMTLLLSACQIGNKQIVVTKTLNNKQVFRIGSSVCELKEAKVYLANYQNIYGTAYGIDLWQHDFGDTSLTDYVKDVSLEELTRVYSMKLLAETDDMTLSEEEKQLVADAAEEYYDSLSRKEISYMGVSQWDIENYYAHYALAQKTYHSLTDVVNEEVSDDEARVMEIMQIFVSDTAKANEVKQKLANGEDFAAVANNYNEQSAIQVMVSRDDLSQEVEDIAFRLENNEVSKMIAVDNGYYFIKCLNKYNEELTEENKENIVEKRQKEAFDDIYNEFISAQKSYLNVELWKGLELETGEDIVTNSFFAVYDKYCGEI